jgi:hypothetical protein
LIEELNRRVNEDPSYKLPPGFIKTRTVDVRKNYKAPKFLQEGHKVALEILDEEIF